MEKLKVILIDDETLIRKLIRMKIDWETLEMEIVTEFSNSKKALEEIEKWNPDIIITDICMPGMDGIEFSEECIQILPKVKIIILTGHDEFDYAIRSIKIGISDYILKPIKADNITKTLLKIKEKINKEKNYKIEYEKLAAQMKENLPLMQENYLNQVLLKSVESEVFRRRMQLYQVDLHPTCTRIQLAVLDVQVNEVLLYIRGKQLTEQFFAGDTYILFCRDSLGRIIILSNNQEIPFKECLELLKKMLNSHLKSTISIGLSSVKEDFSQITVAYKEAVEKLNNNIVENKNCVNYATEKIKKEIEESVQKKKQSRNITQDILYYIEQNVGDADLSMNLVAERFCMSTGYLGRILKKKTGKTYGEYLSDIRFQKAKYLLQTTELKGYEIGEKIGIQDPHYLSIWFKKCSGYSLSEYRKILGQKNESL